MDGASVSARRTKEDPQGAIGETVAGRYRVERLLGEGGMAAVYAAIDGATGATLALKRLTGQPRPAVSALFEREYRTLSGLRHRGIVEVYDYGLDQGRPFYTMELLDGQELSGLAPMPWREACACLRDAASILGLLHARGLIHRDLSPRNLFRLSDGRIKLLDFGALAAVGEATEIVGTPPFLPPEALAKQPLEARSDLYSLGALGYWLLSGVHAYPAKNFAELPRLWEHEAPRLNSLLKLLKHEHVEVPEELDALIQTLLRRDPTERPESAASVIDRLSSIAGLEPEARDEAVQGYLDSKVFVGRERERERFAQRLTHANQGQATTVFVEGSEGVGRTRLLEELSLAARVTGTLVIQAQGSATDRPYRLASDLSLALLKALPERARELAEPHADVLAALSPELRVALGRTTAAISSVDVREERLSRQAALHAWFLELGRQHALTIAVDDLPLADEESQAFLATLALSGKGPRLMLLVTAATGTEQRLSGPAQSMRSAATRLWLLPLSSLETRSLMRSVFGEVRYLDRMSERLHQLSEGNPRYCLELARQLVRTGAIHYADGSWHLPTELAAEELPQSLEASVLARLERVSSIARDVARFSSVPDDGMLTRELCAAASRAPAETVQTALDELVAAQILRGAGDSYRFAHPSLREALHSGLSPEERARVHLALGTALSMPGVNDVQLVRASLHFLRAGEIAKAEALLLESGQRLLEGGVETVGALAPMFEQAVALLDAAGRDKYSQIIPLSMLSFAGYFSDRRYGVRYGERALAVLQDVLRMKLAARLRRFLGARLALFAALIVAGIGLRRAKRRAPGVPVTVRCLLSAASTLAGMTAIAIDPHSTHRYADAIEPLTALGKDHAATFLYRFCRALAVGVEDRPAESVRALRSLLSWLESDAPMHAMTPVARRNYIAGARFSLGIRECWKDGTEGLAAADRLEEFGPLYAMYADQLRAISYSGRGDMERAAHFRKRVEVHAIQLGGAWQVETWEPADATKVALWTEDAVSLKRAAQELARLALDLPSFELHELRARAGYLVLRGKLAEAVTLLAKDDAPLGVIGWARSRAVLVRALREQGDTRRAHALCSETLALLEPEDLNYVAHCLNIQVELALCEAALGQNAQAMHRLDGLLERHAPNEGLLVLSVLHHARARVALLRDDFEAAESEILEFERRARATGISSLLESVNTLKQALRQARNPEQANLSEQVLLRDPARLATHVQALMTRTGRQIGERASRALQIALELTGADSGFVVVMRESAPLAHFGGGTPSDELVKWARERLLDALREDETAVTEDRNALVDLNLRVEAETRYCVTPLWVTRMDQDIPVAAIALGFSRGNPQLPTPEVLRVIGEHLEDEEDRSDVRTI